MVTTKKIAIEQTQKEISEFKHFTTKKKSTKEDSNVGNEGQHSQKRYRQQQQSDSSVPISAITSQKWIKYSNEITGIGRVGKKKKQI